MNKEILEIREKGNLRFKLILNDFGNGNFNFSIVEELIKGNNLLYDNSILSHSVFDTIRKARNYLNKNIPSNVVNEDKEQAKELNLKKEVLYISNDNKTFIERIGELKKGNITITLLKGVSGYSLELYKGNEEDIKEIGLMIKNKRVMDYEGVYFLNKDIVYLLRKCGFIVNTKEVLK